jgi:enoyl-CoA hydratase
VAFIIDIAGAKLRKARSHVDSILLLRSAAGVPSAMLNRPVQPMEKKGTGGAGRQSLFFPTVFSQSAVVWPGSYTVPGNMGSVVAPLLNLHQDQTKFWLHTMRRCHAAAKVGRCGVAVVAFRRRSAAPHCSAWTQTRVVSDLFRNHRFDCANLRGVIEIEKRGEVAVFRMEHGKANVFDLEFCEAITSQLEELSQSSLRAMVITGQGRIFSAGVDLPRVVDGGLPYLRSFLPALKKTFQTLFCFPKAVVAAINGHAIAGGCVLACAADHRLMASQSGQIGVPELLVGVPFPTLALEIIRLVAAPTHFRTVLYRGATFSPEEAQEKGLVDATVEPEKLLDEAVAVAETLAAVPAEVFAITKRQICDPVMKRIRGDANQFDSAVEELWTAPATLAAIRDYIARTFKKSQD